MNLKSVLISVLILTVVSIAAFGQTNSPSLLKSSEPTTTAATLNAREFPGDDIVAQVNAAAASCARGSVCHIVIPPSGQLSLTTPIVMVNAETVECSRSGYVRTNSESASATQLNYTGTGIA
jgi:hypothetical protein